MTQERTLTAALGDANPLAADLALFDMYMAALDDVFAEPEVVIAFDEFGLPPGRLRTQMMIEAGRILRTAAPEFAAYEDTLARNAIAAEIDSQTITVGTRRDMAGILRLLVRGFGVTGVVLLAGGLAGIWYWWQVLPLIGAGAALLAAAGSVRAAQWAARTDLGRMVFARIENANSSIELKVARIRLMSAISSSELLAQLRTHINTARRGRFNHEFSVSSSPGLSEVYDSINRVPTAISAELDELLSRLGGGSIGVAGPRGSGKSMLIRQYCEETSDTPHDLQCTVSAPVDYAAQDFVLHLFATLCRTVIGNYELEYSQRYDEVPVREWLRLAGGLVSSLLARVIVFGGAAAALLYWTSGITRYFAIHAAWVKYAAVAVICAGTADWAWSSARRVRKWGVRGEDDAIIAEARDQLTKVRYVQTYTSGLSGGFNLSVGGQAQLSRAVSRAEQPLSYPEVVEAFRGFARTVAASAHKRDARVFIGVDELDKIGSPEQAERFLNEIKGIFGIAHVYFIVSVSDDALTAFERRGLPLRDAFDSSFDEIINVGPLNYGESRRLLYRRVVGLSEPYVALCHCLAGGLARDLIRSARNVVRVAAKFAGPADMSDVYAESDDPVGYLIFSDKIAPAAIMIDSVAESVIRDELRRKIRATSHVADGLKGHDTTELQELFYGMAHRLSRGESIASVRDRLTKPATPQPVPVADLRLDIAAFAYYCATLNDIFAGQLTSEQIIMATSEPASAASFDTLAAARNALALDTMLAWHLITEFRAGWSLKTQEPPICDRQERYPGT